MQTYDPIAEVLTGPAQLSVEDALYGASATSLLARLREIPGCVDPVLLIGHNPGLQDLLVYLAADGKPAALSRARSKFPTAGLAALRFDGAWADLRPGTAYLESFWTPKDHLG
jgi:phosphohistidine phosphatase